MFSAFKKIRPSWPVVVLAVFYLYLGFHALSGSQGLLKWAHYEDKISKLELEVENLKVERQLLEVHANDLRINMLNLDQLDEIARKNLNVSHPKEIVIWLDESP